MDLETIRAELANSIPWSPLDFISGVSLEGDRALFMNQLTGRIDASNDLRFAHVTNDGEVGVFAEKLAWDSEFFSFGIAKLYGIFPLTEPFYRPYADYKNALEALVNLSKQKEVKYLFANVDARDLALIRAMGDLGFSLIETRLTYHRDIRGYQYKERFPVRFAEEKDISSLGAAAAETINIYDRFHSDPFLSKHEVDRLMYKWVEASVNEGFADATLVPDSTAPAAFCTIRYHKKNWELWKRPVSQSVVLGVVSSEFKGWYKKLISEIHYHLSVNVGTEHVYVTTQVTNRSAISTFESLGYRVGKCEHVFRILL